jgi:hypothetical protein
MCVHVQGRKCSAELTVGQSVQRQLVSMPSEKVTHQAHQSLYRSDRRMFEIEKYVEIEEAGPYIQGSVDIYDRRRNIPLEFRTRRASDSKEPKKFHVELLKYYMSMLGSNEGYIIYQLLMHFGETPFKSFRITMNSQERENQRGRLIMRVKFLERGMESGNASLARGVREEDPSLNWLCKDCPYLVDCKRIQDVEVTASQLL